MALKLTSLAALAALPFDQIIDVRAPSEYAEDHIPGAINLPVLSDDERAQVGTIYVKQDRFLARKVGAALVARNAADHLEGPLADRDGSWRPLVYCWRGGQRSGSFASILAQVGWRVELIEGGYKSYRRLVVQALYDQPLAHRLILIDGGTGTGKTRLLVRLAKAGAQVVDLEGMAAHRGSLLGGVAGGQPSQKGFESRVAMALARLDPARPVFVEAESNKIGRMILPPSLWQAMMAADHVRIDAPLAARARYLTRAYADLLADVDLLCARLAPLKVYHGAERIEIWQAMAQEGAFEALAEDLVARHYDPRYVKAQARGRAPLAHISLSGLAEDDLDKAADEILAITGL
ncbi:tRNA 2-selenouridine(34) synthase MnmH [Seohaeicola saemankumensis]|uniref:tRNA 2-selenouridine(34) synthase MnmH n=1 Tax=Seohaeicola saemankumensis TaxID=481181 RepID=UPI001E4BBDA9|nr:tRNA 2-selenouridine(34) synthase MnmH [Seohaeicola saemankumensis]MCD1625743.1 tRNA 2-selenouridine(34) synthase MnmH [Seohaeicola saemankumensis]